MIKSFRNKQLARLWGTGQSTIDARLHKRILIRLAVIDEAWNVSEINLPGYNFHGLHGHKPRRYSVHVNGPWCITFEFNQGHAAAVDFEQYH